MLIEGGTLSWQSGAQNPQKGEKKFQRGKKC